jgi:hypothetical protein
MRDVRLGTFQGILFAALAVTAVDVRAQEPETCIISIRSADFAGPHGELARLIQLYDSTRSRSFMLRRAGEHYEVNACRTQEPLGRLGRALGTRRSGTLLKPLPAELLVVGNSAYPRDRHDGALWAGRGLNASVTAGAEVRWRFLTAAVAPVVTWQANADFEIIPQHVDGLSAVVHPWWGSIMDAPQRFGESSYSTVHPGQSFLRADLTGVGIGISTENMTWGPALLNPILLSGTGPGFPHIFLETSRPLDLIVLGVEFQLFWGVLRESAYFDDDPDNDRRVLAGALLSIEPYFVDGLHVGVGRMHAQTWWPDLTTSDLLLGPYTDVFGNPQGEYGDNQLIAVFLRWAVPRTRMDVYGEWAREDHWGKSVELLRNLDSSQGWTLGVQKLVDMRAGILRVGVEITHLEDALPILFASRGAIPFYSNTAVTQGHTHRGQWLGAPIGTGGESQSLAADWFSRFGRTSLSVERARYEAEAYHFNFMHAYGAHARDSELTFSAAHLAAFGSLAARAEIGWSRRWNRSLIGLDAADIARPYRREDNVGVRISARWQPWP